MFRTQDTQPSGSLRSPGPGGSLGQGTVSAPPSGDRKQPGTALVLDQLMQTLGTELHVLCTHWPHLLIHHKRLAVFLARGQRDAAMLLVCQGLRLGKRPERTQRPLHQPSVERETPRKWACGPSASCTGKHGLSPPRPPGRTSGCSTGGKVRGSWPRSALDDPVKPLGASAEGAEGPGRRLSWNKFLLSRRSRGRVY